MLPSTLIFSAKMFVQLTLQFLFAYICICNRVRSVSFSNGGWRDCDIIFRDETGLAHVFCFFSCLVKFPAREANSWRRRASPNPGDWACVFFSPSYSFSIFSRSNAHTHTNKEDTSFSFQCIDQVQATVNNSCNIEKLLITKEAYWSAQLFSLATFGLNKGQEFHSKKRIN